MEMPELCGASVPSTTFEEMRGKDGVGVQTGTLSDEDFKAVVFLVCVREQNPLLLDVLTVYDRLACA